MTNLRCAQGGTLDEIVLVISSMQRVMLQVMRCQIKKCQNIGVFPRKQEEIDYPGQDLAMSIPRESHLIKEVLLKALKMRGVELSFSEMT